METYGKIIEYNSIVSAFVESCKNSQCHILRWLKEIIPSLSGINFDELFFEIIKNNNLDFSTWFQEEFKDKIFIDINDNYNCERFVIRILVHCDLKTLKWFISKYDKNIDYRYNHDYIFAYACREGKIEIAEYLFYNIYEKKISENNNFGYEFINNCKYGRLSMSKFLHDNFSKRIGDENYNIAFVYSCKNGNIDEAKWLKSLGKINIHYDNNFAYFNSIENDFNDISEWLLFEMEKEKIIEIIIKSYQQKNIKSINFLPKILPLLTY